MADNITVAGATYAADDIGGVLHQRVKVGLGADGTAVDIVGGTGVDGTGVPRVTLATDIPLPAGPNLLGRVKPEGDEYETVAASQTTQVLGATGATGDYLAGVLIIPATTSPGAVAIKDGSGAAITVFAGGTDSVLSLHPFMVPLGITSGAGAWQITTGANVSVIGIGNFT